MGWVTRGSRIVYENAWIRVREDDVTAPDGRDGIYGVVDVRNIAVFIVALDDADRVLLVDLDRYTIGKSLEIVAGGTDGEDPLVAAGRELAEEAGLAASDWTLLGRLTSLNGVSVAHNAVYLARGLRPAASAAELARTHAAEGIGGIRWVPFNEVLRMIADGSISDGETVAALALASLHLGRLT
jgi:8-oxo-dGTP pyrophosphatase MutT (NUDIX family)